MGNIKPTITSLDLVNHSLEELGKISENQVKGQKDTTVNEAVAKKNFELLKQLQRNLLSQTPKQDVSGNLLKREVSQVSQEKVSALVLKDEEQPEVSGNFLDLSKVGADEPKAQTGAAQTEVSGNFLNLVPKDEEQSEVSGNFLDLSKAGADELKTPLGNPRMEEESGNFLDLSKVGADEPKMPLENPRIEEEIPEKKMDNKISKKEVSKKENIKALTNKKENLDSKEWRVNNRF
jgi:hypothetical protein